MNINDKVAILLCTYNGDKYLKEQIDSIIEQTHQNWVIYVSDDGSTDATLSILKVYQHKLGQDRLYITCGPKRGFAWNFISSLQKNGDDCSFFAFCDQDDIWSADKLEVAIKCISAICTNPLEYCVLYGSRTILINGQGDKYGISTCFRRKLDLKNALVQCFAGGNTMVFTYQLKKIIESLPIKMNIVSHDWLLYMICSALEGKIFYDHNPKVFYRQHNGNLVGTNLGIKSKLTRFKRTYNGEFKDWNVVNEENLSFIKKSISAENLKIISSYYHEPNLSAFRRLISFIRSGVYRQSKIETFFLMMMSYMGKLR